jgi:predicted lactoylglutathione lyase
MQAKMIWANFSVKDAERSRRFYTQLGFKPNGRNDSPQLASFLFGEHNFVIHFFEAGSRIDDYLAPGSNGEIIFTLSAETEAEVQAFAEKVKAAGGTIFQEAGRDANNYYGLGFADPDGHKFNVLLMEAGM